jgi:hypothetical protein
MPKKPRSKPTRCIEYFHVMRGGSRTGHVTFAGVEINLHILRMYSNVSLGYLSHVFSGKKNPTISSCIKIADGLGMDLGCFVEELVAHTVPKEHAKYGRHTEYVAKFNPRSDPDDTSTLSTSVPLVPPEES